MNCSIAETISREVSFVLLQFPNNHTLQAVQQQELNSVPTLMFNNIVQQMFTLYEI